MGWVSRIIKTNISREVFIAGRRRFCRTGIYIGSTKLPWLRVFFWRGEGMLCVSLGRLFFQLANVKRKDYESKG